MRMRRDFGTNARAAFACGAMIGIFAATASPALADDAGAAREGAIRDAGVTIASLLSPPAPPPLVQAAAIRAKIAALLDGPADARDKAANEIAALGDAALPALIVVAHDETPAVAKEATEILESMGKRTAADAVQTKRIDVLEAVLAAYAMIHDEGAVPAVLSFATSDKAKVREAARAAILAYGKTAMPRLREEWMNLKGASAPREWDEARLASELFAAYDRASRADLYALLDAAVDKAKSASANGDEAALADAVATFDKVLAREPELDRRADTIPGYVQFAQMIEPKDAVRAREIFERALRLDPKGHHATQIESELAYLDAKETEARGAVDRADLERAAALDPGNEKARAALSALDAAKDAQSAEIHKNTWAAAIVGIAAALAILFVKRRRA